jgi:hypothetical protein
MRIPAVVLVLSASLVGRAREGTQPPSLADASKVIDDLRLVPGELAEANSRIRAHVDEAMARFDHGARVNGKSWQGADAGLNRGQAEVMQAAIYKLFLARMIAARDEDYQPAVLADCDRLQELIAAARQRIENGDRLARRMFLVPARDLSAASATAAWRTKIDQLRKARAAAEESVKRSLLMLPLDLTGVDSADTKKDSAWEMLENGVKPPRDPRADPDAPDAQDKAEGPGKNISLLPIQLARNRRITLINEPGYRIALTDPAIEDRSGQRIFYEEEWEQRGRVVVRMRWRVGVEPKSGQHVLIKRYRLVERRGTLDDLYRGWDPDYLWYLEPAEDSPEPSRGDIGAALARAAAARQEIRDAIDRYALAIHQAVERNDQSRAEAKQAAIDGALAAGLREKLFAIRGHLAGVESILALEKDVRQAIEHSWDAVTGLESLAAWGNIASDRDVAGAMTAPGGMTAAEWDSLQGDSAAEIDSIHAARLEAQAALPPDVVEHEATFGALQKGLVVHIFRPFTARPTERLVRFIQEIWGWQFSPVGGSPEVRRTVALIQIDSRTGDQIRIGDATKYYRAGVDATLEDIFDQYGGQDLPLSASR